MGIAYEAEQERPARRVALKIVRPGAVPAAVLRRFELEYELLGRLQHPGIAQICQAGIEHSEHGPQPYFAMELVRGRRLDEYLRAANPDLRARLLLMAAIADAVQHAHHRGIIHRDLKPANILVTDAGEPKVLDFGIARAAAADDVTRLRTAAGEVLGTLRYMSPEQVAGDVAALDTRSDVYARGVLLYEAIAGQPPYDVERKPFAEAARIIHDEEPTRLRAAMALEDAAGAGPLVRAETRARLVNVLYLAGKYADAEPVAREALDLRRAALGPSHPTVASSLDDLGVMLMLGGRMDDAEPLMREALRIRRAELPAGDPQLAVGLNNLAYVLWQRGSLEDAEAMYREALAIDRARFGTDHPEVATKLSNLARLLQDLGRPGEAEPHAREALEIRRRIMGADHPGFGNALDLLAGVLEDLGRTEEAIALMRDALANASRTYGDAHRNTARMRHNLGWLLWKQGRYAEAAPLVRSALDTGLRTFGSAHRVTRGMAASYAHVLNARRDYRAAEATAREALAMFRDAPNDRLVVSALVALSHALVAQRRAGEAEPYLREALALLESARTPPLARYPWLRGEVESTLGEVLAAQGDTDAAERLLLAGYEGLRAQPSSPAPRVRAAVERLTSFYAARGRAADAAAWRARLGD